MARARRCDFSCINVFCDADWRTPVGASNSDRRARGGRIVSRSPTGAIDKETAKRRGLRIRQVMSVLTGMECRGLLNPHGMPAPVDFLQWPDDRTTPLAENPCYRRPPN